MEDATNVPFVIMQNPKNERDIRIGVGHEGESHSRIAQSPGFAGGKCLGGGRLLIDPDAKSIVVFGKSDTYGPEPDRALTMRLLSQRYVGFQVTEESSKGTKSGRSKTR